METAKGLLKELNGQGRTLRERIPAVYAGFAAIDQAVMTDDALSRKMKELVALAIAVTRECDGCVASHARGAARAGATEAEVAEVLGVTIQMNGGPATVWAPRAFAAYQEFVASAG